MSWTCRAPGPSDSWITEPHILLCRTYRKSSPSLRRSRSISGTAADWTSRYQTFLDIAVFPEPVLSSADVVQGILDFVVAKRFPRAVLEDSMLYVSRTLAHLVSLLLMLPLPQNSSSWENLDNSFLCLWEKSRMCFMFELSNLHE